jgi:hypothetical protein
MRFRVEPARSIESNLKIRPLLGADLSQKIDFAGIVFFVFDPLSFDLLPLKFWKPHESISCQAR